MADVTISDLELAPALADDMVFPVENTTDTYAATLAMLRRLLNKTFVEEEDADFNDLTDDGFYQCTGTPTNSPEAGAINWTLQVSAESGVVVQRAFSLDDNFANLYIRRWNGVTWTAWIEEGGGALTHKANTDADNFTITGKQNIVGWGMPDYSAGVALSPSTLTTITTKGWINYTSIRTNSIGGVTVSNVLFQSGSSATNDRGSMMIPVDVGDTVQGVIGGSDTVTFYPCKGV